MSAKSRTQNLQYLLIYCSILVVGMGSSKIGVFLFHPVMELLLTEICHATIFVQSLVKVTKLQRQDNKDLTGVMDHNYCAYIAEGIKIEERPNSISCSAPAIANNCCFYTPSIFASERRYTWKTTSKFETQKVFWSNSRVRARN
jgi:hypothetical protein